MRQTYNSAMEHLRFSEDFGETTMDTLTQALRPQRPARRGWLTAACVCALCLVMIGTALAVSPTLRNMLFRVRQVEETGLAGLPETEKSKPMTMCRPTMCPWRANLP